jgi:hypothetical protein
MKTIIIEHQNRLNTQIHFQEEIDLMFLNSIFRLSFSFINSLITLIFWLINYKTENEEIHVVFVKFYKMSIID